MVEGELDLAKLATGDYILEGLQSDDYDRPYPDSSHFEIGDTITLHNNKGRTDQTPRRIYHPQLHPAGKGSHQNFTGSDGSSWDYNYYLPAGVYKSWWPTPAS